MLNIVITDTNLGDGSHEIAELHEFRVSCHQALTEDSVLAVAAEADAILVQWAPITRRVLTSLPRLRVVVRYGIGLDNIDLDAAAELGIAVSNVDDYCLAEVADHAAAAIYAHNRRLTTSSRSFAERGWTTDGIDQPLPPGQDPVGIAGFGRIGRSLAKRVGALGFPIHIWDPYLTEVPESVIRWDTVRELAAAVNHLSIHMPSTQQTAGTIDESVLEALGARGHLVNTARGALVDEDALLSSLNSGALGFASLDVLSSEPPTSTAAVIAEHERVLVTPHIAYLSTDSLPQLRLRAAQIARQLLTLESVR